MESSQSKELSIVKNWSYYFSYEWVINNFSRIQSGSESPLFEVKLDRNWMKWQITVKNFVSDAVNNVGVNLKLCETNLSNLGVNFEFIFLNSKHKKIMSRCSTLQVFKEDKYSGFDSFVTRDILLKDISYDDILRVIVQIRVSNSANHLQLVMRDFTKLRLDGDFSDITIVVHGREFHAHKAILAARSPVFLAMFQHDMKEALTGIVKIDDIEPEVFEEFLKFIYMEDINIDDNASKLLAAAEKYSVMDLKSRCEYALIKIIDEKNCFKLLSLSHLHSAMILKKITIEFIASEHFSEEEKNRLDIIEDSSLLKELIKALLYDKIIIV